MLHAAKLVDAGIDYIRVTSNQAHGKVVMFDEYRRIVRQDEELGYVEQNGGAFGFVGRKVRHAMFGSKEDWDMCQISGGAAKRSLRMAVAGTQATRIDIQVTYRVRPGEVEEELRQLYETVCDQPHPGHRPPMVRMIEERRRAQTVYVGSRASDFFVRCYDKFEESGKEEHRDCLRIELEIKGRAAKAIWQHMASTSDGPSYLCQTLKKYVSKLGIEIPDDFTGALPEISFKREQSKEENQLAWLKRQVSGTVAKLAAVRGWIQPFSMLFDTALTEFDKAAIMRSLTVVYGH